MLILFFERRVTGSTEGKLLEKVIVFIATGAYSGYSPFASGTVGTLAAIPLYLLISGLDPLVYLLFLLLFLPLSFWSAGEAERIFGKKDSGKIVIDEIIGYLVTMFMLPGGVIYIVAGFLLFRFFDITKIFPANAAERMGGGPGVVMDDVVAGIYANLSLRLIIFAGIL